MLCLLKAMKAVGVWTDMQLDKNRTILVLYRETLSGKGRGNKTRYVNAGGDKMLPIYLAVLDGEEDKKVHPQILC